MPFWYKVMRAAAVVGGLIFLFGAFFTALAFGEIYRELLIVWEEAKPALIMLGATIGGGMAFVWGMGWTLSSKERKKMNEYNKLQSEKKKKQIELERKRRRLLRKHGLEQDAK